MMMRSALLPMVAALLAGQAAAAASEACQRDADCEDCQVCRGADGAKRCVDPGAAECHTSEDCDHYELCDLFRDDRPWCGGVCRDWGDPCMSDADCPECSVCVQGAESRQCRGFGVADCTADADCASGLICDLLRDEYPQCGGTCSPEEGKDKTRTEITGYGCSASASAGGHGMPRWVGILLAALLLAQRRRVP